MVDEADAATHICGSSQGAGEDVDLGETFDVVVLSDLVPYVHDLVTLFDRVRAHCRPDTRVIINSYSRAWRPLIRAAETLGAKPRKPIRNWVGAPDVRNLLDITGFETITETRRIVLPKHVPGVVPRGKRRAREHLAAQPSLRHVVGRRASQPGGAREASVSVVVPCRNERGNVRPLVDRVPKIGTATELVFVEGGSRDGTRDEIEAVVSEPLPDADPLRRADRDSGKGNAVRDGFAVADNDLLMILDGDLSVRPEDLPGFYRVWSRGHGRVRQRLPTRLRRRAGCDALREHGRQQGVLAAAQGDHGAAGQGHAVRHQGARPDVVSAHRGRPGYFGEFDPFGDFDLLLGAARLNLKIVDVPIRYQPRTYGETNISRWRHGVLLLRMTLFAFWKFRVEVMRVRRRSAATLEHDEAAERKDRAPARRAARSSRAMARPMASGTSRRPVKPPDSG